MSTHTIILTDSPIQNCPSTQEHSWYSSPFSMLREWAGKGFHIGLRSPTICGRVHCQSAPVPCPGTTPCTPGIPARPVRCNLTCCWHRVAASGLQGTDGAAAQVVQAYHPCCMCLTVCFTTPVHNTRYICTAHAEGLGMPVSSSHRLRRSSTADRVTLRELSYKGGRIKSFQEPHHRYPWAR